MSNINHREHQMEQAPAPIRVAHARMKKTAELLLSASYWVIDQDEARDRDYNLRNIVEYAHQMIDEAYAFRDACRGNPLPVCPACGEPLELTIDNRCTSCNEKVTL
jgi:hypothetical protein